MQGIIFFYNVRDLQIVKIAVLFKHNLFTSIYFYRIKVSVLYKYILVKKLLSTLVLRKVIKQKKGEIYFKKR